MPAPDPDTQPTTEEFDIVPTDQGYAWVTADERHELIIGFGTVHVKKAVRS